MATLHLCDSGDYKHERCPRMDGSHESLGVGPGYHLVLCPWRDSPTLETGPRKDVWICKLAHVQGEDIISFSNYF